jgi:hypothetical protein
VQCSRHGGWIGKWGKEFGQGGSIIEARIGEIDLDRFAHVLSAILFMTLKP